MRTVFRLAPLTLLLSSALLAQAPATPATLNAVGSQGCPIIASAQRWASGGLALTGKPARKPDNATLYLHFNAIGNNNIVAAKVVLHGTTASPRTELAGGTNPGDLSESRDLNGDLRDTSLALGKIVNVRWLSIAELRYADGTTWHESGQAYCHIAPNGFRLVDAPVR
jgi:hypothetical protein